MNSLPTFLWKLPPQKPKFNDFGILFEHANFCSRMLEMHSNRPRFQNLFSRRAPGTPLLLVLPVWKSCPCAASFFLLHLLQSFCHLLKTLLKTLHHGDLKLVLSLPVAKVCNSRSLFQSSYYCLGFGCFVYYHGVCYSWMS